MNCDRRSSRTKEMRRFHDPAPVIKLTISNSPQNIQLAQQKQQKMQRDPLNQDSQQHPQSPGSAENAPSPSKRPRLNGANFNPQQQMPNGRGKGMPQQVGDSGPSNI